MAPVVDRDGDRVAALLERRLERPDDVEVGREVGEVPFAFEGVEEPDEVARWRGELGRRDLDVVEADTGSTMKSRTGRLLRTTWRWTWLSGGTSMTMSPRRVGGA